MIRLVLLLLVLGTVSGVLAGCAQNATVAEQALPRGQVTKFGLFRERGKGWVQNDPSSSTGKTIRGATLEFTEDTNRVPLRVGVQFGYRYWLKFPAESNRISFRRILLHPPMSLPDGSSVTRSERGISKRSTNGIVTSIDAYGLSEEYELVEGDWVFQIWHEDRLLAEQKFTTYWPATEEVSDSSP